MNLLAISGTSSLLFSILTLAFTVLGYVILYRLILRAGESLIEIYFSHKMYHELELREKLYERGYITKFDNKKED